MLPNDDDNYEGDYVSIIPRKASGRIPGPVVAHARSRLSSLILAGDGSDEIHQGFSCYYEGSRYDVLIRQVAGGYKLMFRGGPCSDKEAFLLVLNDGTEDTPGYGLLTNPTDDDTFFAYYTDAVEEEIDPIEGTPRPDPETAERTKFYRVPTELRNAYAGPVDPDIPNFDPIGYLPTNQRSASLFTGQAREATQCFHLRGRDTTLQHNANVTHGIVEFPHPRVVGTDAADERSKHGSRKFWMVEISSSGVYAVRTPNSKRCCDSWTTGASVPDGHVNTLADRFADSDPKVTKLLDDSDMTDLTDTYFPVNRSVGWAFSYSGHEAQYVGMKKVAGKFLAARAKISFALVDDVLEATFSMEESDVTMASIFGSTLQWGYGLDPTDFSFRIDILNTWIGVATYSPYDETQDAPFHVHYDGDTEMVFRARYRIDTPSGGVDTELAEIEVNGTVLGGTLTSSLSGTVTTVTGSQAFVAKTLMYDRECVAVLEVDSDFTVDSAETPDLYSGTVTARWHIFGRSEHITLPDNVQTLGSGIGPGDSDPSPNWDILFFMGGGLYYVDKTMTPDDQKTNKVYLAVDYDLLTPGSEGYGYRMRTLFPTNATVSGGFSEPDQYPAGFVGRI